MSRVRSEADADITTSCADVKSNQRAPADSEAVEGRRMGRVSSRRATRAPS